MIFFKDACSTDMSSQEIPIGAQDRDDPVTQSALAQLTHPNSGDSPSLEGRVAIPSEPLERQRSLDGLLSNIEELEEEIAAHFHQLCFLEQFSSENYRSINQLTLFYEILRVFAGTSLEKDFSQLDYSTQFEFLALAIRVHFHELFLFVYETPLYRVNLALSVRVALLREAIKCLNDCGVETILTRSVDFSGELIESFFRTAYRFGNGFALELLLETRSKAILTQWYSDAVVFSLKTAKLSALDVLQKNSRFSCLDLALQTEVGSILRPQLQPTIEVPQLVEVTQSIKRSLSFSELVRPEETVTSLEKYEKDLYARVMSLKQALIATVRENRAKDIASWGETFVFRFLKFLNWPEYTRGDALNYSSFVFDYLCRIILSESRNMMDILISFACEKYLTAAHIAELCFFVIQAKKSILLTLIFLSPRFSLIEQEAIETLFELLVSQKNYERVRELMATQRFVIVSKDLVFLACVCTLKDDYIELFSDYINTPQFSLFSPEQLDCLCEYSLVDAEEGIIEFVKSFKNRAPLT